MENKEVLAQEIEQKKKAQRGFTLIELLVVMAIIAILAAIAIPQFNKYRANAMLSNVQNLTKSIAKQIATLGTSAAQNPACSNATTLTLSASVANNTLTIKAKNGTTVCDEVEISVPDWVNNIELDQNAQLKLTANKAYIAGTQPVIKVISTYTVGTTTLGCGYDSDNEKLVDADATNNKKCSLQ